MKLKYEKANQRFAQNNNSITLNTTIKRSFAAFVALVVLLTVYALILPAKTETADKCPFTEHIHSEECYSAVKALLCEEVSEEHIHTDTCYTEENTLVCETEVHAHTAECYVEISDDTQADNEPPIEEAVVEQAAVDEEPIEDISQYTDFEEFLATKDENGNVNGFIESYLFDGKGNYIEHIYEASGENYTYMLHMEARYVLPDTYIYHLPEGITVDIASKTGEISNGSSSIGTYKVSDDCSYILFTFDKSTIHVQTIRGDITLKVEFEEILDSAVSKKGYYISEDGVIDGYFHFEVNAMIPASRADAPKRQWKLIDRAEITDIWEYDFDNEKNEDDLIVTIAYDGVENEEIFHIREVYNKADVKIAYFVDPETKEFYLVNRCECEDDTINCANFTCKSSYCDKRNCEAVESHKCQPLKGYNGWCTCWSLDKNLTLTLKYKNATNGADGTPIFSNQNEIYDNSSNQYENRVTLYGSYIDADNRSKTESRKSTSVVEFTNMLEKIESQKATSSLGYESVFTITLNPKKADFSKIDTDGDQKYDEKIIVIDTMKNLKYVSGSMKIVAEDVDNNQFELEYGKDFEVTCTNTEDGSQLGLKLLKLGRYKYTIEYGTTVYNENGNTLVEIVNNVSVELFGQHYEHNEPTFRYARTFTYEDDWDYLRYYVNILKVDYYDRAMYLPDAEFGLYSADGYLIASATTDENGKCLFETNAVEGIIFTTDSLYYISEIRAPDGYELDTTKYWFYFSESQNEAIEAELEKEHSGANVRYGTLSENKEYVLDFELTNEQLFQLPETGGTSQNLFIIAGVIVLAISFSLVIIKIIYKKEALRHVK